MSIVSIDAHAGCYCEKCADDNGPLPLSHYYMVGKCQNCDSLNMVLAFRYGHPRSAAMCPHCGVALVIPFRAATKREIEATTWGGNNE